MWWASPMAAALFVTFLLTAIFSAMLVALFYLLKGFAAGVIKHQQILAQNSGTD